MKKTVATTTIGCKVNLYDTQALLEGFILAGYDVVDFGDFADVYVINTCSVTNLADKKSRQMVGRARQRNPQGIVAAVGCSTQANADKYRGLGVDIVLGNAGKNELVALVNNFNRGGLWSLVFTPSKDFEEAQVFSDTDKTRAFLKVQDGCDSFCTYCIIPYVRGRSRSRKYDDVMAQAKIFAKAGYKEIVVAGIHVASYGKDLGGGSLLSLLGDIAAIDGIERVRLSSVEPNVITSEFCEFVANHPKFCDHLHLSLQSGSDEILKQMNRKYTAGDFRKAVQMIRAVSPDIAITTDIIAGFPAETDEHHAETMAFLKEIKLANLHVFPYSAKDGTQAAKMKLQLTKTVKTRRVRELLALSDGLEEAYYLRFVGRVVDVLVEEMNQDGYYVGKTTNYLPVHFIADSEVLQNDIVAVELEEVRDSKVFGRMK
ncbi:MAG: tRNA (N(6)-L-threonylcarbamoyladenosine(37)-C(2))-methylthiotransferase MtaB [Defluviitaleaceae bacterium]|nr:tRNA (N(6)-L-threonylcarbamoyladenosine(37)-C(2))-methylthiotransferase MtaB [Defluviitaleaceae bacterium]